MKERNRLSKAGEECNDDARTVSASTEQKEQNEGSMSQRIKEATEGWEDLPEAEQRLNLEHETLEYGPSRCTLKDWG